MTDMIVYRYSEQKTLVWLEKRFEMLKTALLEHGSLHDAIVNDGNILLF